MRQELVQRRVKTDGEVIWRGELLVGKRKVFVCLKGKGRMGKDGEVNSEGREQACKTSWRL